MNKFYKDIIYKTGIIILLMIITLLLSRLAKKSGLLIGQGLNLLKVLIHFNLMTAWTLSIGQGIVQKHIRFCLYFLPLIIYLVYAVLHAKDLTFGHGVIADMTLVFFIFIMCIFDSCIKFGLIGSNNSYIQLLHASGMDIRIVDKNYKLHYSFGTEHSITREIMKKALTVPVELSENIRLSGTPISGGYILWLEDVSQMNYLLNQLKETGERLSEENYLLQAELKLKERQVGLAEKERLYDKLTKEISKQIQMMDELLSQDISNKYSPHERLICLCILGTYIKRRSNLIILNEDNTVLSAKELEFSFRESSEAISQCNIPCLLKCKCEGLISAKTLLFVYDFFEDIIEIFILSLKALLINLKVSNKNIKLKLQLSYNNNELIMKKLKSYLLIKNIDGRITKTWEEDTLHISLYLEEGSKSI